MSDASRVLVALRVRASTERAFSAFTDDISAWWRPNDLFAFSPGRRGTLAFEPGPDGRLVERYDDGSEFVIGQVRVWEPPRRLVVGWRQAGFSADQDTELHVTFEEVPGDRVQTRVSVEHYGWDTIPADQAVRHGFPLPVFQLRFAEWWQTQLASLRGTVDDGRGDALTRSSAPAAAPPAGPGAGRAGPDRGNARPRPGTDPPPGPGRRPPVA